MDFIRITFVDILDIVLVAMLMYYLYKVLRGTHAMSILSGILLLFVVYIVVRALNMELLTSLIGSLTSVGLIALVIIFQPEIRRFLQCGAISSVTGSALFSDAYSILRGAAKWRTSNTSTR